MPKEPIAHFNQVITPLKSQVEAQQIR